MSTTLSHLQIAHAFPYRLVSHQPKMELVGGTPTNRQI